ncbi:MAG TPA: selenide, water dikinase [Firmicutes bacterium]|nr:selenide, water dikinase [Bacillota bacterium]
MGDFKLYLLIAIVVVLIAILIYSMMIVSKKKQYFVRIDDLDYLKHEISNKTVPFELAKLRSTKKSERIVKLVQQWEQRWGSLENEFITVTEKIIYTEELVEKRSFTEANDLMDNISEMLEHLNTEVDLLLEEIKSLKRSEERSRSNVVGLKEKFEQLKMQYDLEQSNYVNMHDEILNLFKEIEALFLKFNECMEECNYDLADETINNIKKEMEKMNYVFDRIPIYHESIEKTIKPLLKDVMKSFENLSNQGIYLNHLKIDETIVTYEENINQVDQMLKRFEFEQIESMLLEVEENSKQMIQFMKREMDIKGEVIEVLEKTKATIMNINTMGTHLNQRYYNIKNNYTLAEEDENNFNFLLNEIQIVTNELYFIEAKFADKQTSNTEMSHQLESITAQIVEIEHQLQLFDVDIEHLYDGEKDCRQRALLLLNRFNDLKAMYNQSHFPVENQNIVSLIEEGNAAITALFKEIDQVPIHINNISEQLQYSQEMLEHIINSVNQIVQELKLAETLIVHGHRYLVREGMYVVDLTIAEDQFRQGNYATVIEKMKKLLKSIEGSQFDIQYDQFKQSLDCYLI